MGTQSIERLGKLLKVIHQQVRWYRPRPSHFPLCPAVLHRAAHRPDEFLSCTEKLAGWTAQLRRQTSHCPDTLTAVSRAGPTEGQREPMRAHLLFGGESTPRLQTGPREMWQQQDATQTPWTGSSPVSRTTAGFHHPPYCLRFIKPGTHRPELPRSRREPCTDENPPISPLHTSPGGGRALAMPSSKKGGYLPRTHELPHPGF